MKVLWIYVDINSGNYLHYNHGVGDLDAIIRERGHDSCLIYLREEPEKAELIKMVRAQSPEIILFPTNTHQWIYVRVFADWIKEEIPVPIAAGGIHVICDPEAVIEHCSIDFICPWEGDVALPQLLDKLESKEDSISVQGIWSKENGKVIRTEPQTLIEDLDCLPVSTREIWDMRSVMIDSAFELSIMAGRGCPFSCTYCANSTRKKAYKGLGKYVRIRSPEKVIKIIENLEKKYYFKKIFIEDDIFTNDLKWAYEFCDLYKKRFDYRFKVYIHADKVDRDILKTLKNAGCYMVMIGVETGNEKIRKNVLKRNISDERITTVLDWCDKIGLKTWTFNIIGWPDETMQTIDELFALNETIAPNRAQISIFYPYPKTELFNICQDRGLLTTNESSNYFELSILDLPGIQGKKLEEAFALFRKRSLELQAKKESLGYFDFLEKLSFAKFGHNNNVMPRLILTNVWGDQRLCVLIHPRQSSRWEVDILPNTILKTAFALDPVCLNWGGMGVEFRIAIGDSTNEKIIFSKYIDPKKNAWQNRWHEISLDLSNWNAEQQISFLTLPHHTGDLIGAWGVWAKPHLLEKGKDEQYYL